MIPREIPKRKFIGESVSESSFIASKGIDETKAPTQRDTLANIKNLEVNYDGSLSPRKPLTIFNSLSDDYIYIDTAFNGDYIALVKLSEDGPYSIAIINKNDATKIYTEAHSVINLDVHVINTASSTIIQNCNIGSVATPELATFKFATLNNGDWNSELMKIEIDTLEYINGQPQINPNLMLSNPFALRDKYDSRSVAPIGILAYIKGQMDETNQNFIVSSDAPNEDPITGLSVKQLTEETDYKIIESLPKLGTNISNFNHIFLKMFINNIQQSSGDIEYFIRWEKTTNGVYWEPANDSFATPASGTAVPDNCALIYVPNYVLNTSIAEDDAENVVCLFKKYTTPERENDKVTNRADILKITDINDLSYSFRALVYMVVPDNTTTRALTNVNYIINNVDGKSSTESVAGKNYYIPNYDITRTTRTFSVKLTFDEEITSADAVFDISKFTCKVYAKHTYNSGFSEVRSISTPLGNTDWGISNATANDVTITGAVDISNDLATYPYNRFDKKQCALHYVTYLSVYYNNTKVKDIRFLDIIQLKDMSNAFSGISLKVNGGILTFSSEDSSKVNLTASSSIQAANIQTIDSTYINKLYKMPSTVNFTGAINYDIFKYSNTFYTITSFHLHSGMKKLEIASRNAGSTGSYSVINTFTRGNDGYEISASNASSVYNRLISFFNGTADFAHKTFGLWVTDNSNNEYNITFSTAQAFRFQLFEWYNYLYPSMELTKPLHISFTDSLGIYSSNNQVIVNSGKTYSYIIPNSAALNVDTTLNLITANRYIWYNSTYNSPDVILQYPNVKTSSALYSSEYYYNYFGEDSRTYSPPSKFDTDWVEELAYNGYSLGGDGLPYTFLHNPTENVSILYLDLGCNDANKGYKLYWNHRIVSYGEFGNNILFSDSDSLVTPLLNTLTLNASQDTQITTVVPWRNYLVTATKEAIYLVYEIDGGFGHKAINTFIGIPEQDRRTCKAILNGIIFKSNNKIYTLQPGLYSNDDSVLNIAEISQPIESLLSKVRNSGAYNFAISTSKYYYIFTPGYPTTKTTCFKYDYVRRIWTTLEFPVVFKDYIQTTEDELYLVTEDNLILSFEKDFTDFVNSNNDTDNDNAPDKDIPYGDYLSKNTCIPISFVLDTGEKTDNISTTKQFVETKLITATMDNMDNFPINVDIYIDGMQFKNIHTDLNTDGAVLKQELQDSLILGTDITSRNPELQNVFRQLILRYSGKGKSIRHIISGNSTYNFKIYVAYYRYKLTHNKQ